MARPSKLSEAQWAEIDRLLIEGGMSQNAIARQFGISGTTLREYIAKSSRSPTVQKVAHMLVEADAALKSLPVSAQITARDLAGKLKAISESMATAAMHAAASTQRLQEMSWRELAKVGENPMDEAGQAALKAAAGLTRMANESSELPLNLLTANKERIRRMQEDEMPPQTVAEQPVRPTISREAWLQQHGLS